MRIALPAPARPERVSSRGAAAPALGLLGLLAFLGTLLGLASLDTRGAPLVDVRGIQCVLAVTTAPDIAGSAVRSGRSAHEEEAQLGGGVADDSGVLPQRAPTPASFLRGGEGDGLPTTALLGAATPLLAPRVGAPPSGGDAAQKRVATRRERALSSRGERVANPVRGPPRRAPSLV